MHVFRHVSVLSLAAFVAAGCSRSSTASVPKEAVHQPAPARASSVPSGPGVVSGQAPAAISGFPSIVILEPQGVDPGPQKWKPVMDQVSQTFTPDILLVRTGQPVEFRNNDPVLHNVRVRENDTHEPSFNVAIPTGETFNYTFKRDGFYEVGCDIHPSMTAEIVASSSPYMTTADKQGQFSIDDVPPGTYKAVVYYGADKLERTITIAGATSNLDLSKP